MNHAGLLYSGQGNWSVLVAEAADSEFNATVPS
jgi:hypothetical protein